MEEAIIKTKIIIQACIYQLQKFRVIVKLKAKFAFYFI